MNHMEQHFLHIRQVGRCAALMYYRPGSESARLLDHIKYRGCSRLAVYLGEIMAREAQAADMLSDVDYIVPVPLHPLRRIKRGYNQSLMLARGISRISGIPVAHMIRCRYHRSQTTLSSIQRRKNVKDVFSLSKSGRRIINLPRPLTLLLVDDVCTTGATLSSVAEAIIKERANVSLRILTLAVTDR